MEYFQPWKPLRGETFVARKITRRVAEIKLGKCAIILGNLDAKEIGGIQRLCWWNVENLQHDKADDFVIATGETLC